MYVMTSKDRLELETYRALGTPEEIKNRLNSPYPLAEEGYAPIAADDARRDAQDDRRKKFGSRINTQLIKTVKNNAA